MAGNWENYLDLKVKGSENSGSAISFKIYLDNN